MVKEKHLQKYVDEFAFRQNTKKYSLKERFDYFFKNIGNGRPLPFLLLLKKLFIGIHYFLTQVENM